MKILLDECLPAALVKVFAAIGHDVDTVRRAGYGSKKNGELLSLADGKWDVLLTSDRNIKYQQNLTGKTISIIILPAPTNRLNDLLPLVPACAEALLALKPGQILEIGPV